MRGAALALLAVAASWPAASQGVPVEDQAEHLRLLVEGGSYIDVRGPVRTDDGMLSFRLEDGRLAVLAGDRVIDVIPVPAETSGKDLRVPPVLPATSPLSRPLTNADLPAAPVDRSRVPLDREDDAPSPRLALDPLPEADARGPDRQQLLQRLKAIGRELETLERDVAFDRRLLDCLEDGDRLDECVPRVNRVNRINRQRVRSADPRLALRIQENLERIGALTAERERLEAMLDSAADVEAPRRDDTPRPREALRGDNAGSGYRSIPRAPRSPNAECLGLNRINRLNRINDVNYSSRNELPCPPARSPKTRPSV